MNKIKLDTIGDLKNETANVFSKAQEAIFHLTNAIFAGDRSEEAIKDLEEISESLQNIIAAYVETVKDTYEDSKQSGNL